MIDKKQLLFDLKNHINYISYEDMQFILNNAISYKIKRQTIFVKFENKISCKINNINHNIFWFKNNKYHRDNDLPAITSKVSQQWWINGRRHRDNDKPAVINLKTGTKEWWAKNNLHRSGNKPAIIFGSGEKEYWTNGFLIDTQ